MICTVVADSEVTRIKKLLRQVEMAEIRIDLARLGRTQIAAVFASHPRLIATCRPGHFTDGERLELLLTAVENGAAWVDVEMDAPLSLRRMLRAAAKRSGCRLIVSFHDFAKTPAQGELTCLVRRCQRNGADLVKIACLTRTPAEVVRVLALYDKRYGSPGRMLALGMGQLGVITRLAATIFGAPFTFAAADGEAGTAPGQLQRPVMEQIMKLLAAKERS
jgi:3-dehydroquinate dehydratase type I